MKKIAYRIVRVVGIILLILLVAFVALYVWSSTSHLSLGGELAYKNSSVYEFTQQPITRWVTIKKQGKVVHSFFFYPMIFAAWVDENRPYVFLVTSDTGMLDGAQGLYIYDGEKIKKVYQSRSVEFAKGERSPGRLYVSWLDLPNGQKSFDSGLAKKRNQMNKVFSLSPDGRYLFGYESGYEGGAGFTVDLSKMEKIPLELQTVNDLLWSPDKQCAINFGFEYGDTQYVQLVQYDKATLVAKTFDKYFTSTQLDDVYWGAGCEGVVTVSSDYDANGNYYENSIISNYRFSAAKDTLEQVSWIDKAKFQKSAEVHQSLQNIFFTISDPSFRK